MRRKDGGWLLPSVVNPPRVCVQLWIPDDTNHKRAFWGALYALSEWWNWQRDDSKTARDVARVWLDVFFQAQEQNLEYDACEDVGDDKCFSFPPNAPFIEWFPNNPYTEPDLVGEGYNSPAWYLATPASNLAYGTSDGDVITSLDRFPPGSLPSIIPASGLPRFRVHVNGTGVVKLHLVNMFAGSIAQITVDDNILGARFIDLLRDAISAPPEVNDLIVIETYIDTPGDHYIDVIIVSMFNDQLPFLFHGGGLRKVELCGLNASEQCGDVMAIKEIRVNGCNLEVLYTTSEDDEWVVVGDLTDCVVPGPQGPQGPQGVPGATGPQGAPGAAGECPDCDVPPDPEPIDAPDGVSEKCFASVNAVEVLYGMFLELDRVTSITSDNALYIAGALIAWVAAVILFPPSITIVAPLMFTLLTLALVIDPANFDEEVRDQIKCILYCNATLNPDGTVTFNYVTVRAQLAELTQTDTLRVIDLCLQVIGPEGLNLAGTTTSIQEADCTDCEPCEEEAICGVTAFDAGSSAILRPDLGDGWWQGNFWDTGAANAGNGRWFCRLLIPSCCKLVAIDHQGATQAPTGNRARTRCSDADDFWRTGGYGLNECIKRVWFRQYSSTPVLFKLEKRDCP